MCDCDTRSPANASAVRVLDMSESLDGIVVITFPFSFRHF